MATFEKVKEAPPAANMYMAFRSLMANANQVREDAYGIANRFGTAKRIPNPEFSYSQPAQALRIVDRKANIMVTCKFNQYDKYCDDYLDHIYIRPFEGAPQGINNGNGWLWHRVYADGTIHEDVDVERSEDYNKFINETLDFDTTAFLNAYAMSLAATHVNEDSGIPCIHPNDYLMRKDWEEER